jgi:hypothetical protein
VRCGFDLSHLFYDIQVVPGDFSLQKPHFATTSVSILNRNFSGIASSGYTDIPLVDKCRPKT